MPSRAQLEKGDVVILVIGATGAGKSFPLNQFINALLGQERMTVGSGLASCTAKLDFGYLDKIDVYPALKGRRVVLIDTPGFNNSMVEDFEIAQEIGACLARARNEGAMMGGIIYLHDITTFRFDGGSHQNLQALLHLCADARRFDNVVLATTKWGFKIPHLEDIHTQLEATYWKEFTDRGARVRRFYKSRQSAFQVIDPILSRVVPNDLGGRQAPRRAQGISPFRVGQSWKLSGGWKFSGRFKKLFRIESALHQVETKYRQEQNQNPDRSGPYLSISNTDSN